MNRSESIKELSAALIKFQSTVEIVKKDGTNPFFKSRYATLENIWDTIRESLSKNSLAVAQFPDEDGLTSILLHTSGEWLEARMKLAPKDETPQGQGSAITYARRYALSAILGITTEEDDDGNAASRPLEKTISRKTPIDKSKDMPSTKEQENEIRDLIADIGADRATVDAWIEKTWNLPLVFLSVKDADEVIEKLKERKAKA